MPSTKLPMSHHFYANFSAAAPAIQALWRSLPHEYHKNRVLLVRHDTRVYLHNSPVCLDNDGPLACVVALNPGSAGPNGAFGVLGAIKSDLTLRTIRAVYREACAACNRVIQPNTFVRVLNLSYAVTPSPSAMLAIEATLARAGLAIPADPAECLQLPDSSWYAWGISAANDPVMATLKARFYRNPTPSKACWADEDGHSPGRPSTTDKVWHPRAFATRQTLRTNLSQAIVL